MSIYGAVFVCAASLLTAIATPRARAADAPAETYRLEFSHYDEGGTRFRRERVYKLVPGRMKFILEVIYVDATSELKGTTFTDSTGQKRNYTGENLPESLRKKIQEITGKSKRVRVQASQPQEASEPPKPETLVIEPIYPCGIASQQGCLHSSHPAGTEYAMVGVENGKSCLGKVLKEITSTAKSSTWKEGSLLAPSETCKLSDGRFYAAMGPKISTFNVIHIETLSDQKIASKLISATDKIEGPLSGDKPHAFRMNYGEMKNYLVEFSEAGNGMHSGVIFTKGWKSNLGRYKKLWAFRLNSRDFLVGTGVDTDSNGKLQETVFELTPSELVIEYSELISP